MRVLDHVAFEVDDLDEASRWYSDFLGLLEVWRISEFNSTTRSYAPDIVELASLEADGLVIHLYRRETPQPRPSRAFEHICLAVSAAAELDSLRERWLWLRSNGDFDFMLDANVTDIETDDEGSSIYLQAPNGVVIELHCATPGP